MYNSTIKRKHCKGCNDRYPKLGLNGYCSLKCMPEDMATNPKYSRSRIIDRNAASLSSLSRKVKSYAKEKDAVKSPVIKPQEQWYLDRRSEMEGICIECGASTNVRDDKYYRWSVCHIVPKSLVPSVATYEHNWIELCQQHHQEFDNTFERAEKMKCFGEAKMKFKLFQKLIPANELRKVNPNLLT